MRVAGLFAGIGGLELGLAEAGHDTSLFCELDLAARAVLAERFPEIPNHPDVCTLADLPGDVDVVTAGFPCQDLSQAGRTAGIAGLRSGLVGEVFRLVERRRVPWVVLENVPFMLQLAQGKALEHVTKALEDLGYLWAYRIVNTMAFGLPQRRKRVFIVASREGDPSDVLFADEAPFQEPATQLGRLAHGFYWTEGTRGLGWAVDAIPTLKNGSTVGIPSPPAILLPDGRLIQPDIRDAERLQGFPEDWTQPAAGATRATRRWALVGNAVSVPVAAWLGRRLADPGRYTGDRDRPMPARRWPNGARFDGKKRHAVEISEAPIAAPRDPLHLFLRCPGKPLSERATAGFLARASASSLRFPAGFLDAVEAHLHHMRGIGKAVPVAAE